VRAREREEKHRRVSSEELIEQITTFSLVGYETASGVIHFTLWALARDPARQQRLREEILQFGREPKFDEIWGAEALPYLDAVVKEGYVRPRIYFIYLLFIFNPRNTDFAYSLRRPTPRKSSKPTT
jgi:hypothetical protein